MKPAQRRIRSLDTALDLVQAGIEKIVAEISATRTTPPKPAPARTRKSRPASAPAA